MASVKTLYVGNVETPGLDARASRRERLRRSGGVRRRRSARRRPTWDVNESVTVLSPGLRLGGVIAVWWEVAVHTRLTPGCSKGIAGCRAMGIESAVRRGWRNQAGKLGHRVRFFSFQEVRGGVGVRCPFRAFLVATDAPRVAPDSATLGWRSGAACTRMGVNGFRQGSGFPAGRRSERLGFERPAVGRIGCLVSSWTA